MANAAEELKRARLLHQQRQERRESAVMSAGETTKPRDGRAHTSFLPALPTFATSSPEMGWWTAKCELEVNGCPLIQRGTVLKARFDEGRGGRRASMSASEGGGESDEAMGDIWALPVDGKESCSAERRDLRKKGTVKFVAVSVRRRCG